MIKNLSRGFFLLTTTVLSLTTLTQPVLAAERSAEVLGQVHNCSTNLPYIPVTATCGTETLSAQTGSTSGDNGKYSMTFHNASCTNGSTVSVTAAGQTKTGTIGTYFWFWDIANVDFETGTNCETPSVPEFGLVTGFITLAGSMGVFALRRRKA